MQKSLFTKASGFHQMTFCTFPRIHQRIYKLTPKSDANTHSGMQHCSVWLFVLQISQQMHPGLKLILAQRAIVKLQRTVALEISFYNQKAKRLALIRLKAQNKQNT